MSEQINKEQTKDMKQEKVTELTDDKLDAAAGGAELTIADTTEESDSLTIDGEDAVEGKIRNFAINASKLAG